MAFPLGARLIMMLAALAVALVALAALYRAGIWDNSTDGNMVFKVLAVLVCLAVTLVTKALVGRAVVQRLELR